jgi:hypothetical protein
MRNSRRWRHHNIGWASRGRLRVQCPYPEGRLGRNPAGRPKVSRHKIGEAFLAALHADFVQYGSCAIERVREERPADCLKVVASILAKEL